MKRDVLEKYRRRRKQEKDKKPMRIETRKSRSRASARERGLALAENPTQPMMTRAVSLASVPETSETLARAWRAQLARARCRRPFMELCAAGIHARLAHVGRPTNGLGAARGRAPATLARASDARSGFSGAHAAPESGWARVEPARAAARGPRFGETQVRSSAPERVTHTRTSAAPRGGAARSAAADLASGGDEGDDDVGSSGRDTTMPFLPRHDFCFTLPWGLFVALCGLAGFVIAGSAKSLAFGGGFGGLLMILGALSLKKWKRGKGSALETILSFGITAALGAMMGKKFAAGASLVPSGVIAIGAACMCLFYISNLVRGGNPPHEPEATPGKEARKKDE